MNAQSGTSPVEVLLFSGNAHTRETVKDAVGLSGNFDLPPIKWLEIATPGAVKTEFSENRFAALVLDAETTQEGGESVSRWLHDHYRTLPPVVMLVARQQDEWMARWSGAVHCIQAPYEADEVMKVLHTVLKP